MTWNRRAADDDDDDGDDNNDDSIIITFIHSFIMYSHNINVKFANLIYSIHLAEKVNPRVFTLR